MLGMVAQWQRLFYERKYIGVELEGIPDYVKIAEAYGAQGIRAQSMNEFEKDSYIVILSQPYLNHILQDALTFVKLTIGTGINFAWNLWQAYDIKELYDDISEARIDIVRLKTRGKLTFFINFQMKCHSVCAKIILII